MTMGPLNNEPVTDKTAHHVADAAERGARVVAGGSRASGFGTDLFFEPTILDGVTDEVEVAREETFGPVAPVGVVRDEAEAIAVVNGYRYGLLSAVFTADLGRGRRYAERVRMGWVNVNAGTNYWESHLPSAAGPARRAGWDGSAGGSRWTASPSSRRSSCTSGSRTESRLGVASSEPPPLSVLHLEQPKPRRRNTDGAH
jgi:succinate-semialdehyde dehydrogenase/glutarate-semialdehyde dehydrogenase